MRKQVLFFICLFLSVLPVTLAQQPTDDALQALLDEYRAANAPAVVLYVWTPDATYAAATGLTRLNRGNRATVDDRFRIGSVSKTYTAVAALQLLDEPTNNLDIQSTEVLEEALHDFEGAILTISHDRYFLDRVVDRVVELKDGDLRGYLGGYTEYLQATGRGVGL